MHTYLVTPASEAESQLLGVLFKRMRIKTQVLPDENGLATPKVPTKKAPDAAAPQQFIPQNQAEQNMLEAVLELKEILAGRRQARPVEGLLQELCEL